MNTTYPTDGVINDDGPLMSVTLDSIAHALNTLDINYTRGTQLPGTTVSFDDDTIMTGFENVMIFIDIEGEIIRLRGTWRGQPAEDIIDVVLAAVNEWNLTQITPRLATTMDNAGVAIVHLYRRLFIGGGLSSSQLTVALHSSLSALSQCAGWLDSQFPAISEQWKD